MNHLIEKYNKDGYFVLRNRINEQGMQLLTELCLDAAENHAQQKLNINDLDSLHHTNKASFNQYSPRSYASDKLNQAIDMVLRQQNLNDELSTVHPGLSNLDPIPTLLAWYPESLIPGFTGFHQDGPEDSIPNGYPHIWIPITDEREGNIQCIPGTHTYGNFPHSFFGQFINVNNEYIEQYIHNEKKLTIHPGDVLIFNTRIMHCLTLNHSDKIAWSLEFIVN